MSASNGGKFELGVPDLSTMERDTLDNVGRSHLASLRNAMPGVEELSEEFINEAVHRLSKAMTQAYLGLLTKRLNSRFEWMTAPVDTEALIQKLLSEQDVKNLRNYLEADYQLITFFVNGGLPTEGELRNFTGFRAGVFGIAYHEILTRAAGQELNNLNGNSAKVATHIPAPVSSFATEQRSQGNDDNPVIMVDEPANAAVDQSDSSPISRPAPLKLSSKESREARRVGGLSIS